MALGSLTLVEEAPTSNGSPRMMRITLVGDGAYPSGGSLGFGLKLRAATRQERSVLAIAPAGNNGDAQLEYISPGPFVDVTVDKSTDLFSTVGAVAHNLSSGDAVEIEFQDKGIVDSALSPPIAKDTLFYVIASGLTSSAFKLSATSGGSSLDITRSGSIRVRKSDKLLVRVGSTGVESAVADQSGVTYGLVVTAY